MAVHELFVAKGWSDGLPIIPPTVEEVEKVLSGTSRDPKEVVAEVQPGGGLATVEKIAVNAVMAGCRPEYLPVIITAIEAMCEEKFNLRGVLLATYPAAPLAILNGPIREKLHINCGGNAFGPGRRSNAAIGGAIRLILLNIGGAAPGLRDRATHGHPGKYTYCIGENEEESPWEPLHVERGFPAHVSTVTVTGSEAPHNINDHASLSAVGILTTIVGTMSIVGCNNRHMEGEPMLVISPEHAATLARDGFSKSDVKEYVYEKSRRPLSRFSEDNRNYRFAGFPDDALIPLAARKEDVMIVVAGGPGRHSLFIPTYSHTLSVTRAIPE
ncbi:MAG: hypothetical protein HYX92_20655 [Chloroflexi bacterium]|nr:hypothetical protein [Chloroflexota bacterium]